MADFYGVLGIPRNATKDDVKKAYRKAALRTHPDRAPADQKKAQEDAFRAVNAAYEILHDDANRTLYDQYGKWPPPQPQPAQHQARPPPAATQNYQSYSNVPLFFDHERAHHNHFAFTDPFTLFNAIFSEFTNNMQAHAAAFHSRHPPNPMFPEAYPFMPFPSFGQAAPPNSSAKPRPRNSSTSPATEHPHPSSSEDEGRGWIKESKVTKMTQQGTRETTVKKTAFDGTVYITRISGDGKERHWISIDGVEKSCQTGAPAVPPRIPLSQTQAQANYIPAQPGHPMPKHVNTAPQTSSRTTEPPYTHARTQSHVPQSTTQSRSQQPSSTRVPAGPNIARVASPNITRVASPAPMEPGRGAYPFAYAKAPPLQRTMSPTPVVSHQENQTTPRRNNTAPVQTYQPASAVPMPRPMSPHFYRSRVSPEKPPIQAQPAPKPAKTARRDAKDMADPSAYPFSDSEARPRTHGVASGYQSSSSTRPTSNRPSRSAQTHPIVEDKYATTGQARAPSSRTRLAQQAVPITHDNSLGLGFVPPPAASGGVTPANATTPTRPFGSQSRSSSFEHIVYPVAANANPVKGVPYGNPMPNLPQMDPWYREHHLANNWQPV